MIEKDVGKRIKDLRNKLGISQEELVFVPAFTEPILQALK